MGGIADRGALPFLLTHHCTNILDAASYRKPLLFGFAALGSISSLCFLLLPSSSPVWPLSGLLSIFANIGFSASIVVLNSYLPHLAASSLPSSDHVDTEKLSRATARISSLGIALGYAAGILLLLAVLFPVQHAGGSTKALRFAIGGSGAWWALFSVPALLLLPSASAFQVTSTRSVAEEQEGLLADERPEAALALAAAEWTVRQEVVDAWKRLGIMLRWHNIQRLRNTFRYLAAWFLLSDGMVVPHLRRFMLTSRLFRLYNAHIDGAPVREDDPPHAAELARASRSTHSKRWYPRCAHMANRAAPPRSQLATRTHNPRLRRKRHSSVRRLRVICTPRREVGLTRACGDVRARNVLRRALRRVPELCACTLR